MKNIKNKGSHYRGLWSRVPFKNLASQVPGLMLPLFRVLGSIFLVYRFLLTLLTWFLKKSILSDFRKSDFVPKSFSVQLLFIINSQIIIIVEFLVARSRWWTPNFSLMRIWSKHFKISIENVTRKILQTHITNNSI